MKKTNNISDIADKLLFPIELIIAAIIILSFAFFKESANFYIITLISALIVIIIIQIYRKLRMRKK